MSLPMMKRILYTGNALELHETNLSPVRMSIFTKGNAGALLTKGIEPNLEITLYMGNGKGKTSQTLPSTNVRHV